ncbi:hypothetical protein SDC9_87045 [bioreactor metagenome]|uniref:Uncharacterized protein n=1 Tax=bioreactor metagenome TaxID=1076179 RepID=A0A644ZHM2_9ZZZZ
MLAIAMGRLVEVHEIHIDFSIGNHAIELCVQVTIWLLQKIECVDPHLRRREGMHPGNDTCTAIIIVCFFDAVLNL